MLSSYFSIALRHLVTQRLYSGINVIGLAVGLATYLLITLYLTHELSFDAQFSNADRIYRISRDYFARGGARARVPASNNAPVAPALLENFPEIEQAARVFGGGRALFARSDTAAYEQRFLWADNSLFDIFDFGWIAGDAATALVEPASIVLTERLAAKYFGGKDPLGQTLLLNNMTTFKVTGVIRDLPDNTHLSFDALGSLTTLPALFGPAMLEQWDSLTDFHTYVRLREGAAVEQIRSRIPDFMNRRIASDASSWSGMTIMNVRDIHLRSTRDEEWTPSGSLATVYGFGAIALLILSIACINFMNLSTARSATRAKEVGLRKSLGATRAQLIAQFLAESVATTAVAMLIALVMVELVLPTFNALLQTDLHLEYFGDGGVAAELLALTLIVGVVAGSYPAFYLSAFDAARVLKGDVAGGRRGATFRSTLVVVQFSIAIALVIGTAVVFEQMRFTRNLDLGFNKDQIVVLAEAIGEGLGRQWPTLKQRLLEHSGIVAVTASHYTPFSFDDNTLAVRKQGSPSFNRIQYMLVDYDFFETYEIDIVAGRSFSRDFSRDAFAMPSPNKPVSQSGLVVNESAARLLGWSPGAATGELVELGADEQFSLSLPGTVVGVARDAHFESIHVPVRPILFLLTPEPIPGFNQIDTASVRVAAAQTADALEHIDAVWHEFLPAHPISRRFLDVDHAALYQAEQRQEQIFFAFSALAILVACLGLLGLASYSTERRTKEIGVRKVMGGTIWDIVSLFTADFGKLVLAANLVAWPAAYLLMQRWLTNFAYRIDLSPLTFAGSAVLALVIAGITVGVVAARAASAKPIHSLRYE